VLLEPGAVFLFVRPLCCVVFARAYKTKRIAVLRSQSRGNGRAVMPARIRVKHDTNASCLDNRLIQKENFVRLN
jgi:hypothetical protein